MSDAKDILGVSNISTSAKKSGVKSQSRVDGGSRGKPEGVSREVYALTGGIPPVIVSFDPSSKGKQKSDEKKKISWRWSPFTTSARSDGLQLQHWVRVIDGEQPTGDHAYAKYNKAVNMIRYSEAEYDQLPNNGSWSKEETDHLFKLCEQFDLRFLLVADRYDNDNSFPQRSVEELKDRFYTVARSVARARLRRGEAVEESQLLKEPFNMNYEVERKQVLSQLLLKSRSQEEEEARVLAEAKRITESRKKASEERSAAAAMAAPAPPSLPLHTPLTTAATAPSMAVEAEVGGGVRAMSSPTTAVQLAGSRPPRVYVRGLRLAQTVEKAANTAGARLAKRIEQMLEELAVRPKPQVATRAVCAEYIALRKEVVALLNLQRRVQWKENELAALRESLESGVRISDAENMPSNPGLLANSEVDGGGAWADGPSPGRRDVSRKGTESNAPTQKRQRKLKSSDD